MAEQQNNQNRRRAAVRQERDEEVRAVRQRLDTGEERVDDLEFRYRQHEVRIQYIEAPLRWVLRNFRCVKLFWETQQNNFAVAKSGFLAGFVQELREHTGRVCEATIEEIETLLAFRHGRLMIGLFRTGGMTDDIPDSLLRLQQGWAGLRLGHLLEVVAGDLTPPLILHTDRVRVEKGKGKGKGPAGVGGGKGAQGKGKRRVGKGKAMPKRAAGGGA